MLRGLESRVGQFIKINSCRLDVANGKTDYTKQVNPFMKSYVSYIPYYKELTHSPVAKPCALLTQQDF